MIGRFRALVGAAFLLAAALDAGAAWAQAFPNRPIRFIVPYAAGGGVDIVGRAVGNGLTQQFGWTVVTDNRTGAGSNIGSAAVAKSEPDGYTLLIASNANTVNGTLYANAGYDPATELVPIVLIGRVPMVLLAAPSFPVDSARAAIAYAKANPGKLNVASGGIGTSEHLTFELFKRRAGIEALHVPYRGGAAAYPDLMSGQVQLMFNNQLQAMSHVQAGSVKALAITSQARSQQLPAVPTLAEQGIENFNAGAWWGVMGPRGMPAEVVATINRAVNAVLESTEVTNRLTTLGAERLGGTSEQFDAFYKAETATWSAIIKAEGIKAE